MKLEVGMYVRHNYFGIGKITNSYESSGKTWFNVKFRCYEEDEGNCGICEQSVGFKASYDIIDLIEAGDLLYVDIDNGYQGGIIVPRIAETLAELNKFKLHIKDGTWILKKIITHEQLEREAYKVGE